ncbi:hypothetical protein BDQ17DRAFT_1244698, partial [Cyathus striatus]
MTFTNANNFVVNKANFNDVGGDQNNIYNNYGQGYSSDLERKLKPVEREGRFPHPCMEGTRQDIFSEIGTWLNDTRPETPNIMWIDSAPGAGKSAIASSLVSKLKQKGTLGAYFFFRRGDENLSKPTAVWNTIAYDLACYDNGIKHTIQKYVRQPAFNPYDIEFNFKGLIQAPLTKYLSMAGALRKKIPVIVIDALDECDFYGVGTARYHQQLANTLVKWSNPENKNMKKMKLIFTSRNIRLPSEFMNIQLCYHIKLETGDDTSTSTNKDIEKYFQMRFQDMVLKPKHWPTKHDI